jgi:superfamily I DNA/RNA helicase
VRALLALQAGDDRNMIVLGDAAQNVYRSGFRWKDLGLSITGSQSTVLKTSHRSTAPIIGAATSLLKGQARRLGDDLVLPEHEDGDKAGTPKVRLWTFRSRDEELQSVAFDIDRLISRGANPGSVGVLVDDPEARRIVGRLLAELEQPTEDYQKEGFARRIDVFEASVKLLSTGSAKGLEFQVLYLPQVTATTFPAPPDDTDEADRRRRSLYTAILRGSWQVTISTVAGAESPLLAELGKNWIEAASPNESSPDAL